MRQHVGSNYLLDEPIGAGATGRVWRARTRSGEPVAVKVLRSELAEDEQVVHRFVQEGTLLRRLSHTNLIGVRDLVIEGPVLAIVMDLASGPDLRQELGMRGTLPAAEAVTVAAEVLSGLATVHAAGIVHRDVKPENVVLDQFAGTPRRARLTDFGVSRLLDAASSNSRTQATVLVGTPSYMAPEQALPGPVTPAADVYAVGCLLYELLCGVPPFTGSPLELIRQHADRHPGRIPGVSDGLWGCLAVFLLKDPAHRPSAAQAAADLRALVAGLRGQPALPARTEPPVGTNTLASETVHVASYVGSGSAEGSPSGASSWSAPPAARKERANGAGWRWGRRGLLTALLGVVIGAGAVAVATGGPRGLGNTSAPTKPSASPPSPVSATPSASPSSPVSATPSAGSPPTGPSPLPASTFAAPAPDVSTPPSGPPTAVPASVPVLAANGQTSVQTWNGPSTTAAVFGPRGTVTAGSRVAVICSAYGEPVALNGATARLWDYTTAGWLNDQLLQTNSPDPVVPGCLGNVRSPSAGSAPPRRDLGPFPIISDAGLAVRGAPAPSAAAVATLNDGDLVLLTCSVHSTFVPAPRRLAGAGSNDQWDRLASVPGWVPDSNVDSHTSGSAAPSC
jgi:serine/threonine protein kinase